MPPPFFQNSVITHAVAAILGASSAIAVARKLQNAASDKSNKDPTSAFSATIRESTNVSTNLQVANVQSSALPLIRNPVTIIQPNKDLEIAYDARTKNPIYVLERIKSRHHDVSERTQKNPSRRNHSFHEPKSIPPHHRPRNGYYRNSGYDRGHMAAAANCINDEDMNDTFTLANISPQYPVMNRVVWSNLEAMTRKLVLDKDGRKRKIVEDAFVVTGPVWLPAKIVKRDLGVENKNLRDLFEYSYAGFGSVPQLISVPTHFFKVIFSVSGSENTCSENNKSDNVVEFAAFVVPNNNFDDVDRVNLQDYLVRLTDLEAVTGITFFPGKNAYNQCSEVFDLITEEFWMQGDCAVNSLNEQGHEMITGHRARNSSQSISKKRRAKIRKQIREMTKSGDIPKHFCARGSCDQVVRLPNSTRKA